MKVKTSTDSGPQSTKEELGPSKKELLTSNEKLAAYNAELQGKVEELNQVNKKMETALKESGTANVVPPNPATETGLGIRPATPGMPGFRWKFSTGLVA